MKYAFLLTVIAVALPGCVFSVGNTGTGGVSAKRLKALDKRVRQLERNVGIESPPLEKDLGIDGVLDAEFEGAL